MKRRGTATFLSKSWKRRFLAEARSTAALAVLALSLLLSCAPRNNSGALQMMIWGDLSELETVRNLARGFEKIHPEVKVNIFSVNPTDYNQRLQALYLNHQSPDVMYVSREWLRFYAAKGMIRDLKDVIASDREFDFDDFYPQVRDSFFYRGDPYAVAKDFTPLVLYYNQDLFRKAGIPFPGKKWSREDFLSAARKLTRRSGPGAADVYGFVIEPKWLGWMIPWIWQSGGELLDMDESKSMAGIEPSLSRNESAIQFLYDLVYKERVAPEPKVTDNLGTSSLFLTGKAAMCVYGRWMCLNFKQIKDFRWNVAPLPSDKTSATSLLTVGYAISNYSRKEEAAWELIKYLTSVDGQAQVAETGLAVPSRKSVAQSPRFLQASSLPAGIDHKIFLESLESARFPPSPLVWPQMEQEFVNAMDLVFRQKKNVRATLLDFHRKLEDIFHVG